MFYCHLLDKPYIFSFQSRHKMDALDHLLDLLSHICSVKRANRGGEVMSRVEIRTLSTLPQMLTSSHSTMTLLSHSASDHGVRWTKLSTRMHEFFTAIFSLGK